MLSVCGLLGKPLIVIDEPTSALDEESTRLVARYLRMLSCERGTTILMVTHSHSLAETCDKVLQL
jgi:ABC-type lipoprotein export system ATPase subunit